MHPHIKDNASVLIERGLEDPERADGVRSGDGDDRLDGELIWCCRVSGESPRKSASAQSHWPGPWETGLAKAVFVNVPEVFENRNGAGGQSKRGDVVDRIDGQRDRLAIGDSAVAGEKREGGSAVRIRGRKGQLPVLLRPRTLRLLLLTRDSLEEVAQALMANAGGGCIRDGVIDVGGSAVLIHGDCGRTRNGRTRGQNLGS